MLLRKSRPLGLASTMLTAPERNALAKQRQAVERCFSRLKGQWSLNHITVRGLNKVTLHCYLPLIAMEASVPFPSE